MNNKSFCMMRLIENDEQNLAAFLTSLGHVTESRRALAIDLIDISL